MQTLLAELQRTYDVYYVLPKMTHHWNNLAVHRRWVELLGQNVLRLEDPAGICELIASTIGLAEGKVDLAWPGRRPPGSRGASTTIARAVSQAIESVGRYRADNGDAETIRENASVLTRL